MREAIQRINHEFLGERFWMDVRMECLTSEWFRAVATAADDGDVDGTAELFAEAILDWDVSLDGTPFPPTKENLMGVPGENPSDFWRCLLAAMSASALSNATLELEDEIKKAEGRGRIH